MRYKRKSKPVQAVQLKRDNHYEIMDFLGYDYAGSPFDWENHPIMVETPNGTVTANPGDYIVVEDLDSGAKVSHVYNSEAFNIIFEPVEE